MKEYVLKPCPFCGGKAIIEETKMLYSINKQYQISCDGTCSIIPKSSWIREKDLEIFIKEWNTRASEN